MWLSVNVEEKQANPMKTYEFSLRYDVSACHLSIDQIDDKLYEGGCDDVLIRHGRKHEVIVQFTRSAPAANKALEQAHQQVQAALPCARLLEAHPDYVGPTDIAQIYNVSRQRVQSLMHTKAAGVHAMTSVGNTQIFRLGTVIDEFANLGMRVNNETLHEAALAAMQLNRAIN